MRQKTNRLKRSIPLSLITFYGMGTILGAGIYVLIGKVAGIAGYLSPWAFIVALILAAFSAFSYAELSSRFPESAGEATYIQQGFGWKGLSIGTGLFIALAGICSAATLLNGLASYLQDLVPQAPTWLIILTACCSIGLLSIWGIQQSMLLAALATVIEILGLLIVCWVSQDKLFDASALQLQQMLPDFSLDSWSAISLGAFLAFYAFIGFEDMVNMAEEVKNPRKNLPRAILISLLGATVLYICVSSIAVLSIEPEKLSQMSAPLTEIYKINTGQSGNFISIIGIFAVLNGALVQLIKASRLLYGMAKKRWLPAILGTINSKTQTPIRASLLVMCVTLLLSLSLEIKNLAELTSFFTLIIFGLSNLALILIKRKETDTTPENIWRIPSFIPYLGTICSFTFAGMKIYQVLYH